LYLTTGSNDKFAGGHWLNAEVKKSKVSEPFLKTKWKVSYGEATPPEAHP
jgi:hypothetical protein